MLLKLNESHQKVAIKIEKYNLSCIRQRDGDVIFLFHNKITREQFYAKHTNAQHSFKDFILSGA